MGGSLVPLGCWPRPKSFKLNSSKLLPQGSFFAPLWSHKLPFSPWVINFWMCNAGISQNISAEVPPELYTELPYSFQSTTLVQSTPVCPFGKPTEHVIFANALSLYFQSLFAAMLSSYLWTNRGLFYLLQCYTAVDQILSYHLSCQETDKQSWFSCYNANFPAVTANMVHLWLALDARDLMSSTCFSQEACGIPISQKSYCKNSANYKSDIIPPVDLSPWDFLLVSLIRAFC